MNKEELFNGFSIVIPCYNSEKTLKELVERIVNTLKSLGDDFEIILINDGSLDNTWEIIKEIVERNNKVKGINLMRNYGQHNALLCGIRKVKYDKIITMDDDLQHPPEEIPKLVRALADNFDVVYGSPQEQVHSWWRNLGSKIIKLTLSFIIGSKVALKVSAYRIFRTKLRDSFKNYDSPNVSIDVLLSWGTKRFSFIEVEHNLRKEGKSNYNISKLISHAFDLITGFSVLPLRIASIIGLFFTFFGFWVLLYVIVRYIVEGGSIPGFPFLASIISIFSGAQLFSLGIIGEYIARIHFRTMKKQAYTIKEEIGAIS